MIIGFNIADEKNLMINLIINLAQYVIYQNYVKNSWNKKRANATAKALWINFKLELRQYLSRKFIRKYYDLNAIDQVLQYL